MKQVNWDASHAVVSLSPQFAILRYFVMPLVDKKFWSKSIPLESKKYIPVSFDEVVYDYDAVQLDSGKKLGVLFGLTQRKSIEFIINTLQSVGLGLAAVEISPVSMERLFGFTDAKDHASKGYIHFSGETTHMIFSYGGSPVLYRETDSDSSGTMGGGKRLDIKGAVQFVDRYIGGGNSYKGISLSGDNVDTWQPVAVKEADPIPVTVWDPAAACSIKESSFSSLMAAGAALRNKIQSKLRLDISGISAATRMEKEVQNYVWNLSMVLGGVLLFLSVISQIRLMGVNSKLSSMQSQVDSMPELVGSNADAIRTKIENMRTNSQALTKLFTGSDTMAPKLSALADAIPRDLWITEIDFVNSVQLGGRQEDMRELTFKGETYLTKERKTGTAEVFIKALRASAEYKSFVSPAGSLDLNILSEEVRSGVITAPTEKTGKFSITGKGKRK
jgi:hypothetical protein